MRISQRLYLTVTPAILGVLLMAGLAYWGEYSRRAPGLVLVGGAIAVLTSLVLTWSNARYVARRIERLAAGASTARSPDAPRGATSPDDGDGAQPSDEIEEIERAVDRLSTQVELAEATRADRDRMFEQRARDYATLLASVADVAARRLEEVRLPLHILLENRFGELNENQEEMLGAARTAAEAADADLLGLRQIAELDLGTRVMRRDRVTPSDLIEAIRPMLMAAAAAANVTLELDVAPLLPAISGDRARLQEALVTLLRGSIEAASPEAHVHLRVERDAGTIRFDVSGGADAPATVGWAVAARVVQAHLGRVERREDGVEIQLPSVAAAVANPSAELQE